MVSLACAAVQAYLKHCVRYILEHCAEDMDFFQRQNEAGLQQRLQVGILPMLCMLHWLSEDSCWPVAAAPCFKMHDEAGFQGCQQVVEVSASRSNCS